MNILRIFLLIGSLIGGGYSLLAQSERAPEKIPNRFALGYLLTIEGDTVQGYVDPGNPFKDQDKVYFFDHFGGRTTYQAGQIHGFGYEGKHFQAHDMPYQYAGLFADSVLFLQRIVDGPAQLYRFYTRRSVLTLQRGSAYFDMLLMPDGQEYEVSYSYKWKRLGDILGDYPGMAAAIRNGTYKPKDTPELIRRYNLWYQQQVPTASKAESMGD
jgi:hypothetical protein